MPKGVIIVYSGPADASREAEYNRWYDEVHLPEVCSIPGIVSARRFSLSATQRTPPDALTPRYAAIYELDTDDIQNVADEIGDRLASGAMHMSDAFVSSERYPATYFELQTDCAARNVERNT